MLSRCLVVGALAVVVGAAPLLTSPADAARRKTKSRVCMTDHFHYGSSSGKRNKKIAEAEAIASWAGFTAFEYGNAWASFKLARSRNVSCAKDEKGWGCNVEGVPCRRTLRSRRRKR
jgi:hypothetical protein